MLTLRDLSRLSYAQDMTHWAYRTKDTRRDLEGSTYWSDAVSLLNIGDFIFVHHIGHGGAIYYVGPLGQVRCMTEWPTREASQTF